MSKAVLDDETLNETIEELIDDDTDGYYLIFTKSNGNIGAIHDDRVKPFSPGDLNIASPRAMLYYHVYQYYQSVCDTRDEPVSFEDILWTLEKTHEETNIDLMSDETLK